MKKIFTNGCFDVLHRGHLELLEYAKSLKSLRFVDEVWSFDDTQSLEDLVKKISPDVLVMGADWRGKKVVGKQHAKKLKFFEKIDGYSTTDILNYNN